MSKPTDLEIRGRALLRDIEDAERDLKHYEAVRNRLLVALVVELAALVWLTRADPFGRATGAVGIPTLIVTIVTFLWLAVRTVLCYLDDQSKFSTFQSRNLLRERVRYTRRALDDFNFENGVGF